MQLTDLMRHTRIDEISRRGFLKGAGVAAAGAAGMGATDAGAVVGGFDAGGNWVTSKPASEGEFTDIENAAVMLRMRGHLLLKWESWAKANIKNNSDYLKAKKMLALRNQLMGDLAAEIAPHTAKYFYTERDNLVGLITGKMKKREYLKRSRLNSAKTNLRRVFGFASITDFVKVIKNNPKVDEFAMEKGDVIWEKALASYQHW